MQDLMKQFDQRINAAIARRNTKIGGINKSSGTMFHQLGIKASMLWERAKQRVKEVASATTVVNTDTWQGTAAALKEKGEDPSKEDQREATREATKADQKEATREESQIGQQATIGGRTNGAKAKEKDFRVNAGAVEDGDTQEHSAHQVEREESKK